MPIQSDRVEDIAGRTISVAALLEIFEALQRPAICVDLGRKTNHHRERCASVGRGFRHPSRARYLKGSPVEHRHLPVQVDFGLGTLLKELLLRGREAARAVVAESGQRFNLSFVTMKGPARTNRTVAGRAREGVHTSRDPRRRRPTLQRVSILEQQVWSGSVDITTSVRIMATLSSSLRMSNMSRTPDSPAAPNAYAHVAPTLRSMPWHQAPALLTRPGPSECRRP